jgi:TRAP-type C4-dicarboxylate transport system permease small subunit
MLVLSRNLLGFSFPWSEELTRYLLVWLSMLGAAVLMHRNDHISLDLLSNRLPERGRVVLSFVLRLLVLAFLVVLLQQSWLASNARAMSHSPALGISMRLPYLALPVGAALMIVVTLVNLWGELRSLAGRGRREAG